MADIDIRTLSEIAREERYKRICSRYEELHASFPEAAPYRIMRLISVEEDMTVPGVKHVLEQKGLYQSKDI